MKRIAFISLVLLGGTVQAQLKKGNLIAGASIGSIFYNASKTTLEVPPPTTGYSTNNSSYGISITPNVGKFLTDRIAVGLLLDINIEKEKTTSEANGNTFQKNESTSTTFGAGVFARNYFSGTKNVPFVQILAAASTGTFKNEGFYYNGNTYKDVFSGKGSGIFSVRTGLLFGFTRFLSQNAGIDVAAGYNLKYSKFTLTSVTTRDVGINGTVDETYNSKPTQKTTEHGFALSVGLQIFLDHKK